MDTMSNGKPDFGQMYEEYYDRVYKYAYTILMNREDAEDIVEETFITAFSAYGMYDASKASFATWITRIAHNKAVNQQEIPEASGKMPGDAGIRRYLKKRQREEMRGVSMPLHLLYK